MEKYAPHGSISKTSAPLIGEKSAGVARIEAISATFTKWTRALLFTSIFLVAYCYGLDGQTRYTYQAVATASYSQHALLTTVTVLRSVIAAAAQPTLAKLCDCFGRFEVLVCSILFYVVGTIVQVTATGVSGFSGGAIIYQVGYTAIMLIAEVLIGDLTSLRNRVLFSFIPALPFLINAWVSGDVTQAFLGPLGTGEAVERQTFPGWQWGIGSWGIIYFVCSIPLCLVLFFASRKAKKSGAVSNLQTPLQQMGFRKLVVALFWQLDVIGIILLVAVFSLILVPFTISGSDGSAWRSAHIIAMLVIGVLCIPVFAFWSLKAPHPIVPFHLLRDRGVWAALGMAVFLNFIWYMQGSFLYTTLVVSVGESPKSATRISNIYSFTSVITGVVLGFVVRYVRYLKPFIIAGVCLFMIAFGILLEYRGGSGSYGGIIAGEIMLGIGGGLFAYPTQASIQSCTKHEHLAIVTALYLASYNIGSALGSSVSGAIWTNVLPAVLNRNIGPELAANVYASPFLAISEYPMGTPTRDGIVDAYRHVQRLLIITGICLCIPLLAFSLLLRNHRLTDDQSLPEFEREIDEAKSDDQEHGKA